MRRQAGIAQDRGLAKVTPIDPGHHYISQRSMAMSSVSRSRVAARTSMSSCASMPSRTISSICADRSPSTSAHAAMKLRCGQP